MTKKKRARAAPAVAVLTVLAICAALVCAGLLGFRLFQRQTHPIKYEEYVERYSQEFGVDKFFVYAVIKTESGFRPDARSNVGARGLMQIMEQTFDWLKFKQGDEREAYSDMYDPETNIRYGCYLLGYLVDEFGSEETAAAAYHAGRGQVNEWLADSSISADGVHLDKIPIRDTAHYVSKVEKAKAVYLSLYG